MAIYAISDLHLALSIDKPMSAEAAKRLGVVPMAKWVTGASAGVDPAIMLPNKRTASAKVRDSSLMMLNGNM